MREAGRGKESAEVVIAPKQAEEARRVEPRVWTSNMLAALQNGVKGGRWFSLIDKVYSEVNLEEAFQKVRKNRGVAGVDHVTIEHFEMESSQRLGILREEIRTGRYHPQAVWRVNIPKPGSDGTRPLGIPTVRDRTVQAAVRQVIEPIFEKEFAASSYGFRPGRGCKDALRSVERLLKQGHLWVVDADIQKFFDTLSHERLMGKVAEKIADTRVLKLIEDMLKSKIMEGMQEWTPEEGTPQGGVISPLLANIYLNELDHVAADASMQMVRYADDLVILCRTKAEAEAALELLKRWVEGAGLKLHPDKTSVVNMQEPGAGFAFLGYHFERTKKSKRITRWPRAKSLKRFKDKIRSLTRRTNGHSLPVIIERVNSTTKGWFGYFKHSCKGNFRTLDCWIRGRLRSILRKRHKRHGRASGVDHQRWPNAYFAEQGFFSMVEAHAAVRQSARR